METTQTHVKRHHVSERVPVSKSNSYILPLPSIAKKPDEPYDTIPDDVNSLSRDCVSIRTVPEENYESISYAVNSLSRDPFSTTTNPDGNYETIADPPNSASSIYLSNISTPKENYDKCIDRTNPRSRVCHVTWQVVVMVIQCVFIVVIVCVGGYLVWKVVTLSRRQIYVNGGLNGGPNGEDNGTICGVPCPKQSACLLPWNNENCQICASAVARLGYHKICVSSCPDVGSQVVQSYGGVDICKAQNDRNIALPAFGTTCNESSVKYWEPQRYGCFYVMTDPGSWIQHNDAAGGWVRLQFNTTFTVTAVEISSLFRISEQCSIYELEFSTAKFLIDWPCPSTDEHTVRKFYFQPVITQHTRLLCLKRCPAAEGFEGIQRLRVFALD